MRALRFLLRKELRQIFRDRLMVAQMFLVPIIQLLVLSHAATFEVRSAPLHVVDADHSSASRELARRFTASGHFRLVSASPTMAAADEALLDRRASVVLHLPSGFEHDLVRTGRSAAQLVANAEDGAAAGITVGYARTIVDRFVGEAAVGDWRWASSSPSRTAQRPAPTAALEVRTRGWYNPSLEYRDYMVPGILVLLVTVIGTLLTAMNVTREKELGTLDQLNVTPVSRGQLIAAKLLPLWAIALTELGIGLVVARLVLGVPVRGSILLVFLLAAVYLTAALGVGLWVSTMVETQQQAIFVTYFVLMVYLLMSGLFSPVRSMPTWAQWLAQLNPLMHITTAMRAVLLKGAGLAEVLRPLVVLASFGAVLLTLAVRQYARRVA